MKDDQMLIIEKQKLSTPFIAQGERFQTLEGDLRGAGAVILSGFVPASKYEEPGRGSLTKKIDGSVISVHRRFLSRNSLNSLPVFAGLTHPGAKAPLGVKREVPSVIPELDGPCARKMERIKTWDCEMLSVLMGEAAKAAGQAGYDGVVLEAQAGTLLGDMMREKKNFRKDKYGGNVLNRARLVCACIEEIKQSDLTLLIRLSLDEEEKEESVMQILLMKEAGIDGVIIDSGDERLAGLVKDLTGLPVLFTRKTPFLAGAALSAVGKRGDGLVFQA